MRLAFAFASLTIVGYLVAGAVAYVLVRDDLRARQDQRITEVFTLIASNVGTDTQTELIEAVRNQVAVSRANGDLFLLTSGAGKVLAGNVTDMALPPGWSDHPPGDFGRGGDIPYRVFAGPVGPDTLMVGIDYSDLDALGDTIQSVMLWSSLFALVVAFAGGAVIAMRVQRRLEVAEMTMNRVAEGDLAARIPLTKAGDDVDHLAEQVNGALARLSSLVDGMRQVSSDIAHDLRTPLNRLQMRIAEARDRTAKGQDATGALEAAAGESEAIGRTFSALLRIAQIEAGARRERFSKVDVGALLGSVADVYADVAEDAGLTLHWAVPEVALPVSGDAELLTQAFANLIENALRHCPKGTVISCSARKLGGMAELSVRDTGPGIPESERTHVLQRLYRLQRSRTTPGSGLGLSLVKAVADLHGATLTLADAQPGLCVKLSIPVIQRT